MPVLAPRHCCVVFLLCYALHAAQVWPETVTVRAMDPATKTLVPVRIELINAQGEAAVAENALEIDNQCAFAPMPRWLRQKAPRSLQNPYTNSVQHYIDGVGSYELEPGDYSARAFRGPEYRVTSSDFTVESGRPTEILLTMNRWHDARSGGWFAADDHLHIGRPTASANLSVATWMGAEGLHIANLLQMGTLTQFGVAPQYAFGADGVFRNRDTVLMSGQEHPRTHLLGHSISLGASVAIDDRDTYILYDPTFSEVKRVGGINGFAHWGTGPSGYGLAVTVPQGNVEFLEVLGFEYLHLDAWYQLLSMGFVLAATAGTDFPCLPGVPGRERFYMQLPGKPTLENVVASIRGAQTFVTNGPMLRLSINGEGIGSRLTLDEPKEVEVTGTVAFDPDQDLVQIVELVANGKVVHQWTPDQTGSFEFRQSISVDQPTWFALRAVGAKVSEPLTAPTTFPKWMQVGFDNWISGGGAPEIDEYLKTRQVRQSLAHTSPIWTDIKGVRVLPGDSEAAQMWVARLEEMERLFKEGDFESVKKWDWIPYSDGVSVEHLKANASELLAAVIRAKATFSSRSSDR